MSACQCPPPSEDPTVALVERIFEEAAFRSGAERPLPDERVAATHAIWLCACETMDDSPVWLIYATEDGGIGWRRLGESDLSAVVHATHLTGCHSDPSGVLKWLRGEWPYPWPGRGRGDFPDHPFIYDELGRRMLKG